MINTKDQEDLFALIAKYLKQDVSCCAIGGTAMMFYGYKNTTKDIDLVFFTKEEMDAFIAAIEELGYKEISAKFLYKKKDSCLERPKLFSRGDERFDLFLKEVFGFQIPDIFDQRRDFIEENELIVKVLPKEYLILLKAITNRERDYEDIETIVKIEKTIDWDFIIDVALKEKNEWIPIDLEETMQKLKEITFIPSKYFDRIYTQVD